MFLLILGISPRLAVVGLWLVTDRVDSAFGGSWLLPVAGIVLLPWTTALHVVGFVTEDPLLLGASIGLFLDVAVHAGSATMGRRRYGS